MFAAASPTVRGHQDVATSFRSGYSRQQYISSPWRPQANHLVLARPLLQSKVSANYVWEYRRSEKKVHFWCLYELILPISMTKTPVSCLSSMNISHPNRHNDMRANSGCVGNRNQAVATFALVKTSTLLPNALSKMTYSISCVVYDA